MSPSDLGSWCVCVEQKLHLDRSAVVLLPVPVRGEDGTRRQLPAVSRAAVPMHGEFVPRQGSIGHPIKSNVLAWRRESFCFCVRRYHGWLG